MWSAEHDKPVPKLMVVTGYLPLEKALLWARRLNGMHQSEEAMSWSRRYKANLEKLGSGDLAKAEPVNLIEAPLAGI